MSIIRKILKYGLIVVVTAFITGTVIFLWVRLTSLQDKYQSLNELNNLYQTELDKKNFDIEQLKTQIEEVKASNPLGYLPTEQANNAIVPIPFAVIVKTNEQDVYKSDMYIKNLKNNQEEFFITLVDVAVNHLHNAEYYNNNLYIIKQNSQTNMEELWTYDRQKRGVKVFEDKEIDFRVSPFENYVVLLAENRLLFMNKSGLDKTFNHFQLGVFNKSFTVPYIVAPLQWSEDGMIFWGRIQEALEIRSYFSINIKTWEIKKFDVAQLLTQLSSSETALNPNTGKLLYSDLPIFYDPVSAAKFHQGTREVELYVYDLNTNQQVQIAVSKAKDFTPAWLDDQTIEFTSPQENKRVQIKI